MDPEADPDDSMVNFAAFFIVTVNELVEDVFTNVIRPCAVLIATAVTGSALTSCVFVIQSPTVNAIVKPIILALEQFIPFPP
jgi:hypothetical protein